jgi:uncharacterized protein (DUF362 family)
MAGLVAGGVAASLMRPSALMAATPGVVGIATADPGDSKPAQRRQAVAAAVQAATGAESPQQAVAALFRPDDTVGIKLNCLSGRRMSPSVALVEELVELIAAAGIDRNRIIVFERSSRELRQAGFEIRKSGGRYLCFGTDNDYERRPATSGEIGSCFARLVSSRCTALVSFGVVKDHDLAGVSASLKNWYGVIHNPNKYHDSNCNPYVADVVQHPYVRSKLRLTVLDGVEAQCHGGPAFASRGLFQLGAVAASTDPVAADVWAWRQIDGERMRRGLPTLADENREPRFLATAARYGLGVADPEEIQVVTG